MSINKIFYSNHFKVINYVATSDSDSSYLKEEWKRKAKFLRALYLFIIIVAIGASFFPFFLPPSEQSKISQSSWGIVFNIIVLSILLTDYALRWITYPLRVGDKSKYPLIFFPFTGTSIIMAIAILPTLFAVFSFLLPADNSFIKLINALNAIKILRLVMLLKIIPSFKVFNDIFKKQKILLLNVFIFVAIITIIFSLVIYSVEGGANNDKINSFFDALYYVIICITTIGFGDITPNTELGRAVTIVIAFIGVIAFTIPSGIIAGSFMYEMQKKYQEEEFNQEEVAQTPFLEKIIFKTTNKTIKSFNKLLPGENKKGDEDLDNEKSLASSQKTTLIFTEIKEKYSSIIISNLISSLGGIENVDHFFEEDNLYKIIIKNKNKINYEKINHIQAVFSFKVNELAE